MKIGIDISQVIYGTGSSVYTKELLFNLLKENTDDNFILFGGSLRRRDELHRFVRSLPRKTVSKIYPFSPTMADLIWNKLHIGKIEFFTGNLDLFHSSDWTQPPADCVKVTTIHDLSPLVVPHLVHSRVVEAHKRRLIRVKQTVDAIIAPSIATKTDLVNLGFDGNKITVIYEAPSKQYKKHSSDSDTSIKDRYTNGNDYILTVGANKRKNIKGLIEAFERARLPHTKLVVVGRPDLDNLPRSKNIIFAGFVPDNDLPPLYSAALALVYPSFYEGFGLPVLEAFASECPVITSNLSSMPEIAGDAAILVDPHDTVELEIAIKRILEERNKWARRGADRAKEFSWEKCAKETLSLYNKTIRI